MRGVTWGMRCDVGPRGGQRRVSSVNVSFVVWVRLSKCVGLLDTLSGLRRESSCPGVAGGPPTDISFSSLVGAGCRLLFLFLFLCRWVSVILIRGLLCLYYFIYFMSPGSARFSILLLLLLLLFWFRLGSGNKWRILYAYGASFGSGCLGWHSWRYDNVYIVFKAQTGVISTLFGLEIYNATLIAKN